jgi:hypothetical protein
MSEMNAVGALSSVIFGKFIFPKIRKGDIIECPGIVNGKEVILKLKVRGLHRKGSTLLSCSNNSPGAYGMSTIFGELSGNRPNWLKINGKLVYNKRVL